MPKTKGQKQLRRQKAYSLAQKKLQTYTSSLDRMQEPDFVKKLTGSCDFTKQEISKFSPTQLINVALY